MQCNSLNRLSTAPTQTARRTLLDKTALSDIPKSDIAVHTCSKDASKPGVCSRCWRSRPGVATRIFMRTTDACSSRNSFLPPVINPADSWWCFPKTRNTSKIWRASSLVGDITNAASPSLMQAREIGAGWRECYRLYPKYTAPRVSAMVWASKRHIRVGDTNTYAIVVKGSTRPARLSYPIPWTPISPPPKRATHCYRG